MIRLRLCAFVSCFLSLGATGEVGVGVGFVGLVGRGGTGVTGAGLVGALDRGAPVGDGDVLVGTPAPSARVTSALLSEGLIDTHIPSDHTWKTRRAYPPSLVSANNPTGAKSIHLNRYKPRIKPRSWCSKISVCGQKGSRDGTFCPGTAILPQRTVLR